MKTISYTITDALGIHARPAGALVKVTAGFTSAIMMEKDGKSVDAKRLFGLMGLGAKQGDTVKITVDGADEATAATAIEAFLKENL